MSWHERLTTFLRKADHKVYRAVLCALAIGGSVAMVAVCFWCESPFVSNQFNANKALLPKPAGPHLFSQTMSITLCEDIDGGSGCWFDSEDSWTGFLPQDEDEAISVAIAGRMCFPPAVSIALRQMIDDPVNDQLDTMLHAACRAGDLMTIFLLLDAGADTCVKNRFGETPLDLVDYSERVHLEAIARSISDRPPQLPEPLESATHRG